MKEKQTLNFRIHDPNDPQLLASALLRLCMAANRARAERAIEEEIAASSVLQSAVQSGQTSIEPGIAENFHSSKGR